MLGKNSKCVNMEIILLTPVETSQGMRLGSKGLLNVRVPGTEHIGSRAVQLFVDNVIFITSAVIFN